MNNSNEIIMIYANAQKKDIGVLQDYSFDMCYGRNENNFECRLQKYNAAFKGSEPINQDFILYIEFTEYGGIIDKKEINSKTGEIVLSGRTWHGLLNSHIIEPDKGEAYRSYRGEANAVLGQIFTDIGMTDWFEASDENSGITIRYTEVRYKHAYDAILDMLEAEDAKLILSYRSEGVTGGKIYARAISRVNTGVFEDFDTSQTPFVAGESYNKVNELICLGPGDGVDRAVIHLFINKNGAIVPYNRTGGGKDSDYFTDIDALATSSDLFERKVYQMIQDIITPSRERYTEVFDYPNAEIKKNYYLVLTRPKSWKSVYSDYYYLNYLDSQGRPKKPEIKKFEKKYQDKMQLLKKKPADWNSHYKDYYMKETNESESFKKVEELSEAQGARVTYSPSGGMQSVSSNVWKNYFETDSDDKPDLYYEKTGMYGEQWKKVEAEQQDNYIYMLEMKRPFDWKENYSNYYLRIDIGTGYDYISVPGITKTSYEILINEPYDWETSFGDFYMKATETTINENGERIKKGTYIKVSEAMDLGMIDDYHMVHSPVDPDEPPEKLFYPEWKKNTFYDLVTTTDPPQFHVGMWNLAEYPDVPQWAEGPYYKETIYKAPTFVAGKYYEKYVDGVPRFKKQEAGDDGFGGYYQKLEDVEVIPDFKAYQVYEMFEDRYYELCEAGKKKLKELADKDTLDISLELESSYDVGDIIGGKDEETGINTIKPIKRKIIKIKKGLLSIDYEVD